MARTIRTKVYKFSELSENAKLKAISEHIQFEIEVMDENSPFTYCADEMERMGTPWFLPDYIYEKEKQTIIDTILLNEYEFFEDGKLIPSKFNKI